MVQLTLFRTLRVCGSSVPLLQLYVIITVRRHSHGLFYSSLMDPVLESLIAHSILL